jgi:hypothetical protein
MAPPYVDTIVRLVQALWEAGVLIECSPGPYGNVRDRRRRKRQEQRDPAIRPSSERSPAREGI